MNVWTPLKKKLLIGRTLFFVALIDLILSICVFGWQEQYPEEVLFAAIALILYCIRNFFYAASITLDWRYRFSLLFWTGLASFSVTGPLANFTPPIVESQFVSIVLGLVTTAITFAISYEFPKSQQRKRFEQKMLGH